MKVRRPGPDLVSVPDTSRETTVSQRPFPMGISVFSTSVQNCSALFLITHENARQFNSHWIFLFFLGSLLTAQRQMLPPGKPQRTQQLRLKRLYDKPATNAAVAPTGKASANATAAFVAGLSYSRFNLSASSAVCRIFWSLAPESFAL